MCENYVAYAAYAKICIFSLMRSHFSAFFFFNVVLRLLNILAANDYRYLQLDVE